MSELNPIESPAPGFTPVPEEERGKAKEGGIRHTHRARIIRIPAGYVLAKGTEVKEPFTLVLQFGARWHPEQGEPHVIFQAWRQLALGDTIGFCGENALQFIAPGRDRDACKALASDHGKALVMASQETRDAITFLGIDVPAQPEEISSFLLPWQGAGNA